MVKVFIIIGMLLIISGVPGLYWFNLENQQLQQRITFCKAKYSHQVDAYVHNLTGSSLTSVDANDFDTTAAVNLEKMSPSQRLGYQQERLLADIDELAETTKTVPENADLLYGNGWRQKVSDYKAQKQFLATVQVSSVTAAIAGAVLFATALVFLIFRALLGFIRWLLKSFSSKDTQMKKHNSETKNIQQDKFVPPAAVVSTPSNSKTQNAQNPNPTAEEFRKQLVMQTQSLKETAEQLKSLAAVLQERTAQPDQNIAKHLEKVFNSQSENLKNQSELLTKIPDEIRKAIDSRSEGLAAAIENSSASYTNIIKDQTDKSIDAVAAMQKTILSLHNDDLDNINNIKQQISNLVNHVQASAASKQSDVTAICEQIEHAISSKTQQIRNQIESLTELPGLINTKIEEINKNSAENSQALSQFIDELGEIKQQISELTANIHESRSQDSDINNVYKKIEEFVESQNHVAQDQLEPLKQITEMLAQKCDEIKNQKPDQTNDDQLRQDAKLVRQISEKSLQKSDAIDRKIADLTEQVGAIREYAAHQQQHLAKLQDGYDWNLIKNFCMRVIRCVDNLDERIAELTINGDNAAHLLAIREELAFVLESNGLEAFGAKINSDYRGQENRLQVVNERDETDDINLVGKIAQVVRPGYQCRVNDEYTKIVRPAHVRLYGSTCLSNVAVRGE